MELILKAGLSMINLSPPRWPSHNGWNRELVFTVYPSIKRIKSYMIIIDLLPCWDRASDVLDGFQRGGRTAVKSQLKAFRCNFYPPLLAASSVLSLALDTGHRFCTTAVNICDALFDNLTIKWHILPYSCICWGTQLWFIYNAWKVDSKPMSLWH